jgi:hypothetical protein
MVLSYKKCVGGSGYIGILKGGGQNLLPDTISNHPFKKLLAG